MFSQVVFSFPTCNCSRLVFLRFQFYARRFNLDTNEGIAKFDTLKLELIQKEKMTTSALENDENGPGSFEIFAIYPKYTTQKWFSDPTSSSIEMLAGLDSIYIPHRSPTEQCCPLNGS